MISIPSYSPGRLFALALMLTSVCVASVSPVACYFLLAVVAFLRFASLCLTRGSLFLTVHYSICSIYFCVAPLAQQAVGTTFWGFGVLEDGPKSMAAMAAALYMFGTELGWGQSKSAAHAAQVAHYREPRPLQLDGFRLVLLAAVCLGFLWSNPGLNFVPRGLVDERNVRVYELFLLSTLPKTLLVLCLSAQIIAVIQRPKLLTIIGVLLVALMAVVGSSPVTTARQVWVVGLLPGVLWVLRAHPRIILVSGLWLAIAGLGPILNYFSRNSFFDVETTFYPFSADFDAMYVAAGVLQSDAVGELGLGRYMLNAISFVLPREFKLFPQFDPLQTDQVHAVFSQANLAFPPFMTAYLDFGLAGAFGLGLLVSRFFLRLERLGSVSFERQLIFFIAVAAYVPFLRGPILGWGAFALSGLVSGPIILQVCAKRRARPMQNLVAHND